ncbi:MAG: hypothetical protein ACYDB1_10605 [Acidiferrobacteraceae bacterium]
MGLSLATISNGARANRCEVGSDAFFDHPRVVLTLRFVRAAWPDRRHGTDAF